MLKLPVLMSMQIYSRTVASLGQIRDCSSRRRNNSTTSLHLTRKQQILIRMPILPVAETHQWSVPVQSAIQQ